MTHTSNMLLLYILFCLLNTGTSSSIIDTRTDTGTSIAIRWGKAIQTTTFSKVEKSIKITTSQIQKHTIINRIRGGTIFGKIFHKKEKDDKIKRKSKDGPIPVVIGIDGGTESIRACCFDGRTGQVIGTVTAVPYKTTYPQPGWAEQSPTDWYTNLGQAVRTVVKPLLKQSKKYSIQGICIDTTCCSVVMMNITSGKALRPCILWMDQRANKESEYIMKTCPEDPAIRINSNSTGPISAEWLICKSLWIHNNEYELYKNPTTVLCEYQDYINYQLTNNFVASACNVATRWHWDCIECIQETTDADNPYHGRPISLYNKLGLHDLPSKLPQTVIPMGTIIGNLTIDATKHLGLSSPIPVIQGGPDAFVGMIGLGCINNGQLCLITGSSHLHCIITNTISHSNKLWGTYRGVPIPTTNFAEGGQSSTGSLLRWLREKIFQTQLSYKQLDDQATSIQPGCDGLVALETFQGSRTPITDPLAKGAFIGLTLSHTAIHLYRAVLESVCYGTRACIEGLEESGHDCNEIILAGGITRSKLWLQMHADITNKTIVICENSDAPLLGCAILASYGLGIYPSIPDAVQNIVRVKERIVPNPISVAIYDILYKNIYSQIAATVRPITHSIHSTQQQIQPLLQQYSSSISLDSTTSLRGGAATFDGHEQQQEDINANGMLQPDDKLQLQLSKKLVHVERTNTSIVISPSLLACDWLNMGSEISRCIHAGIYRFHVDIFDGVYIDSPNALTFGPQMVQAIYDHFVRIKQHNTIEIDLHVCVDRPQRYVQSLADAGGTRFIFQYEAIVQHDNILSLINSIVRSGMKCGISLNPSTSVDVLYPYLQTGLVDVIDLLAVEPGFGGQKLQKDVLTKITTLLQWKFEQSKNNSNNNFMFDIMIDGGINDQTIHQIRQQLDTVRVRGSDSSTIDSATSLPKNDNSIILVAGTFVFQNSLTIESNVAALLDKFVMQ